MTIVSLRTLSLIVVSMLAAIAPASNAQGRVDVLNVDREIAPQTGVVVVEETLDQVKISKGGGERTYKTRDIAFIEYGPGSDSYERAVSALGANDLMNAESLFAAASGDSEPGWVAAHALLRQAEVASRRGEAAAARDAVADFLTRYPEHRLLPKALLAKARYAAAAGDMPTARQSMQSVIDLVVGDRVTADWAARAHVTLGELLLIAEDIDGASKAYADGESAATTARGQLTERPDLETGIDDLELAARVGTASCMLARDDVTGARSYYTQLSSDGKGNAAVASASANGIAECDFRDPSTRKQAQYAFAQVAVGSAGIPAERARALYFLGRCAETLGEAGSEPNGRSKAIGYWQEVVDRYPDTRWARLAQQSLP